MKKPPEGWPRISPSLFYDDAAPAIDWLVRAFGFEVQERVEDDHGRIVHSQLVLDGGLIMIGQTGLQPDREFQKSPQAVGGANTQSLAVYVDDADAHCE
ncbi:MAG: aminotransferase, partial [Chloroflexi bacterium]|nr:aminotransferase [Chloroflexota bacterium]